MRQDLFTPTSQGHEAHSLSPTPILLNLKGRLYDLSERPLVMGILNVTPDSFYAGSRIDGERAIHERIEAILEEGGDLLDLGGYSTRPGAPVIPLEEEWKRLVPALQIAQREHPNLPVSVDTFRSEIARRAVHEYGASIINDVSGGGLDEKMYEVIGELQVPYILMHMRGTPETMQSLTEYDGAVADVVIRELSEPIRRLRQFGAKDIILDPGFGFSKTLGQNYELLSDLYKFSALQMPLLVGISRKSMIFRLLDSSPQDALNGTTVLNTLSLLGGAHILRVHDVKEASQVVKIAQAFKNPPLSPTT